MQARLLFVSALFCHLSGAVPVQDSPRQRLLDGLGLPGNYRSVLGGGRLPFTPGHKDPLDSPVDSVGDDLDPLPWRNGQGASVLGPWNPERSRQNPDLVRPPSTDHGDLSNMRWSFADSHIRIEVSSTTALRRVFFLRVDVKFRLLGRRLDSPDHYSRTAD